MLKKILLGLVVVVALLVGVSYLFPRHVSVVHTAQLSSPPDVIFPLVETPREWANWSPWNRRDTAMTITYSGPEQGTGARWDWQSEQEGDGFMIITQATPSVKVNYELTIIGMGPPSYGDIVIAPNSQGSMVAWSMDFDMGNNPIGRWFGLFMPSMMRKDFTEGLELLDQYAATKPPSEPIMGREIPGAIAVPAGQEPPPTP